MIRRAASRVGAQFRDVPAHVGMIGKRLRITVRLPRMHDPAQLVVRRDGNAEIDRRVGTPEPVQEIAAEAPGVIGPEQHRAVRHAAILQDQ